MNNKRLLATGVLLFFESLSIAFLIHGNIVWICLAIGAIVASYFLLLARPGYAEEGWPILKNR